ncbi:MAG: hypothetical protein A2X68_03305 [Ignavibacteria bacterium GWC2_56_12]|nr:MAG: hypothetical protein A2X68_03305 [Ignavibacteria bacterium GWC2_56_12]
MSPLSTLLRYLRLCGVPFHAGSTENTALRTSVEEDAELATIDRVVVTPLSLDGRTWLAVTGEGRVIQPHLVQRSFGVCSVSGVHEENLPLLFPGCAADTIPPLGNLFGVPIILDEYLSDAQALSFPAYTSDVCVSIRTADLRKLAKPVIAQISSPARTAAAMS